jgi:hypothetical protein
MFRPAAIFRKLTTKQLPEDDGQPKHVAAR